MKTLVVNADIRLREIRERDASVIFQTIDLERTYLSQWLPFVELTQDVSFTKRFIENYLIDADRDLTCCILYKNKFAGLIGLKDTDYENRKTEIGYWLSSKLQGKGIVTLSCARLMQFAFENLHLNRVQIKAAVENYKSRAIPERLGFSQEGIERDGELHENGFMDLAVYSLLRKEWISGMQQDTKII